MHAHGSKRRVIELCHHLGLCAGYQAILDAVKTIQEMTRKDMIEVATSSGGWVAVWDNLEHTVGVKNEITDHKQVFHSLTTAKLIRPAWWPPSGLRQYMFKPETLLRINTFIEHPHLRLDNIQVQVGAPLRSLAFIYKWGADIRRPNCTSNR